MQSEELSRLPWLLIVAAGGSVLLLGVGHVLRMRYVVKRVRAQLEEQVADDLRHARELPDHFLQAVHGIVLRFHFATDQIEEAHPVRPMLKMALQRADALLVDGRKRVEALDGQVEGHESQRVGTLRTRRIPGTPRQ